MLVQFGAKMIGFIGTVLASMVLIFIMLEVLPGDPALVMLGPDATPDTLAALRTEMGLDRPVLTRFFEWILDMLRGDFGISYAYGVPVSELILDRLAVTLPLAMIAIVITVVLAIGLGVFTAINNHRLRGQIIMALTQFGIAIPSFWFGLLLILLFSIHLAWVPSGGFPGWDEGVGTALESLILPACALALVQAAILTRVTRSALLEVLHEDYIRTARAKGLARQGVLWRHALQNALVPVATVMGLQFASLVAGTIVIENVFALPGLGRLIFLAVEQRDLVVIRVIVVLLVGMVILMNYLVDIAYLFIDPRLRRRPA
ncbi:Glutathione transport system permease protein GsiC [Roseovarius indicus]|uniref:Glutathione transport system permease protein GsiC n=1 Tax=Roseovarius indicus TaxID=540747 RepID=A0A5P3A7L2_9RHOB|nr:Glutathione transport system permease protein GsiC [Roseovarius indicus]SFE05855.1 peptide/nickel transport system permease protein [Roseovarius indicus]